MKDGIGEDGRVFLRQIHAILHERRYRRSVDFVLAIGRVGTEWYNRCGYEKEKVFPFCYVVEKPIPENTQSIYKTPVQITAIGRLVPLKRFDLLLNALTNISADEWTLKIIGDGALRSPLEFMADHLGLKHKIMFTGVMDNGKIRDELEQTDIFILTSQKDGWGAVVNETLMSGVPVICSDYCGAADLIQTDFNGELFRCDDLDSLVQILSKWIAKGPLKASKRAEIKSWSRCIEGETVARYFLDILGYLEQRNARPKIPWGIGSSN